MEKVLTHDEWEEIYKPLKDEDGRIIEFDRLEDVFRYYGKILQGGVVVKPEDQGTWLEVRSKLWTETAGDGWYYISTGFHLVDRMHHFICEVPWKEENEVSVYEDNGTWCDYCDEYTKGCKHKDKDGKEIEGDWNE